MGVKKNSASKNDFDCSSFLILLTSIGELLANLQKLNELCKRITKIKDMGLTGWAHKPVQRHYPTLVPLFAVANLRLLF